jgi:xylose isomerase
VARFLQRHDLTRDFKLNIEVNHAYARRVTFEHEVAARRSPGFEMRHQSRRPAVGGTDQFPGGAQEAARAMLVILAAGGFDTGGFNFDAKLRL